MTQYSELQIGRIVGHCEGWIALDVWIPKGIATKSTRHRNGLPSWMKPEAPERKDNNSRYTGFPGIYNPTMQRYAGNIQCG